MRELMFEEKFGLCFVTLGGLPVGVLNVSCATRPMWLWVSEAVFWEVGMLASTIEGVKEQLATRLGTLESQAEFFRSQAESRWSLELRG